MDKARHIQTIELPDSSFNDIPENSADAVVISTDFDPMEKYFYQNQVLSNDYRARTEKTINTIQKGFQILKNGGLFFVYGLPKALPHFGVFLDSLKDKKSRMIFKYWIALDIDARSPNETFPPAHIGLLMYLKSRSTKTPSPFHLNTKTVRIPYQKCHSCGKITKDWGGKKHLINPLGAAVSDVWGDLPKKILDTNEIPNFVLNRIYDLVEKPSLSFINIIEQQSQLLTEQQSSQLKTKNIEVPQFDKSVLEKMPLDQVLLIDAIEFMKIIVTKYPEGIFDLAFADPPYNLEKDYGEYADLQSDQRYLAWCEDWLKLMCEVLRPGGALMILNLPKWCIHHAAFLNELDDMMFRHWIVWDALSEPAGKIMPAHYTLLYYTKIGNQITFNSPSSKDSDALGPIDAPHYCLRSKCIQRRKSKDDDDKIDLTDIWWDVHRIKHKKDRDQHPCQLPIKLMERIIKLTTNPGDVVFDPFCGAGTTAIVSKMFKRHFITTDIDEKYVEIAKRNLKLLQPTLNGEYRFIRERVSRSHKNAVPRKEIEIDFINLCKKEERVLSVEEVAVINETLANKIRSYYPNIKKLRKIAQRRLDWQ
ncbi:MAG: DNA-methyltransferase [Promethearchaeota archaeon]